MRPSKSNVAQLAIPFALGIVVALAAQNAAPYLGKALFEGEFRTAYVDCALAQAHTSALTAIPLDARFRYEVDKTLSVEKLRCLDYDKLKLRLYSYHVGESDIALIQLDARANEPALMSAPRGP